MRVVNHVSADDMTASIRIIVALTIDVATTAGDWDAMDATDTKTSQNVEAAGVEVTARRDTTATNVERCRKKNRGRNATSVNTTTKKIDAMTAID
jgi:hypothetical protein